MKAAIAVLLIVLVGCELVPETKKAPASDRFYMSDGWGSASIITIRGCEYVSYVTAGGYGAGVCHAGDCNNPIHQKP